MKLDDLELQEFDDLKKIIGQTKAMPKTNQVDINSQGLNNEEYEEKEKLEKKPKKELTEEELKRLNVLHRYHLNTSWHCYFFHISHQQIHCITKYFSL